MAQYVSLRIFYWPANMTNPFYPTIPGNDAYLLLMDRLVVATALALC